MIQNRGEKKKKASSLLFRAFSINPPTHFSSGIFPPSASTTFGFGRWRVCIAGGGGAEGVVVALTANQNAA